MKLKYYLRGMGVGIIVTTVVLMIIFSFHKQETLSDDQIRERAAALGMVMADEVSDSGKLSDTLPDDTPDTALDQTSSIAETQDDNEKDNDKDNEKDNKKDDKKDTSDDKSETKDNDVETVEQIELSIVGGEYSDAVCKKLKRAGVIDDADDFNKYLSEGGYDSLIQPGTYIIPKDADYDTIIRLITERNDDQTKDTGKKDKKK